MSVRENLAFPLKLARLPKNEIVARVQHAAAILELSDLLERKPAQLSGGQRQRVAMGRAIVRKPAAFLLDEPLSNLDARLRVQMRTELARLQRDLGTTTVYVTHDQTEAMTLGDRVAMMRKGKVLQIGTPRELYAAPCNLFVAGFIGSPPMNFLPAEIRNGRLVLPMAEMPLPRHLEITPAERARPLVAGIRPEHFRDSALVGAEKRHGAVFPIEVDVLEWLGADLYLHFELECAPKRWGALPEELEHRKTLGDRVAMAARVDPSSRAAEGECLELLLDARHLHLFDAESGESLGLAVRNELANDTSASARDSNSV
jgi:multiple sugar transport system ATP-binding protein